MVPLPSRALAQPSFNPAKDQTTVRHLRLTVLRVAPLPPNGQHLQVRCGDMGFSLSIAGSPGFKPGDELIMEHPKDDNPMATHPSAIYFASTTPKKEKAVSTLSANPTVTMTSLELVDYINSQRGQDEAQLSHSDFLKKVPLVLGKDAGNFSSIYKDSMNRDKPC